MLRPGIITSTAVNSLTWPEEVFYRRLMSVVDDYGRFDGRDSILRANLYPLQLDHVSDSDVGKWKVAVANAGLVRIYFVNEPDVGKQKADCANAGLVRVKEFIEVVKFNQRTRGKPKWPPPVDGDSPQPAATRRDSPPYAYAEAHAKTKGRRQAAATRPPRKKPPAMPEIPRELGDEFARHWAKWLAHRREKKQPVTPTMAASQLADCAAVGEETAIAIIEHTISSGWQGLRGADGRTLHETAKSCAQSDTLNFTPPTPEEIEALKQEAP